MIFLYRVGVTYNREVGAHCAGCRGSKRTLLGSLFISKHAVFFSLYHLVQETSCAWYKIVFYEELISCPHVGTVSWSWSTWSHPCSSRDGIFIRMCPAIDASSSVPSFLESAQHLLENSNIIVFSYCGRNFICYLEILSSQYKSGTGIVSVIFKIALLFVKDWWRSFQKTPLCPSEMKPIFTSRVVSTNHTGQRFISVNFTKGL